jgi:photosystem II stability/assembly factor-like uncharacterized protein
MSEKIDIEAALRASLAEHARHAPAAGPLAERVLAQVDHLPPARERRRSRQWRTWTLPLVAAGSVAAVAAALVGVNQLHHNADRKPPAVPASSIVPTPTGPAPTATKTPAQPSPTATAAPKPVNVLGLTNFSVTDLSFVGAEDGWGLGTADCLNGGGTCAAMVRTSDGGKSWHSMPTPPANVPLLTCAHPCIRNLRFATDAIGYAFGPSALFMTTDGGKTWHQQPGGADALETLDGNVIRVVTANGCTPPGCSYSVRTAPIGAATWHNVSLGGYSGGTTTGVSLSRTGHFAYLMVFGHPAGGAGIATSTLYVSDNDGSSWVNRGEPCPQTGGGAAGKEVDSIAMTSAPDGSVTVVCTPRGTDTAQFTATSTDTGATFHPGALDALSSRPVSALGAASRSVLLVADGSLLRSTDGGRSFSRPSSGQGPGDAMWFGFESDTVGRSISAGGRTIWMTRDAGQTWTAHTFG